MIEKILRECPVSECGANHEGFCASEEIYGVDASDCPQNEEALMTEEEWEEQ